MSLKAVPGSGMATSVAFVPLHWFTGPPVVVSVKVADFVPVVPAPEMVMAWVPSGLLAATASVRVDVKVEVPEAGENDAVTPAGTPLARRLTFWPAPTVVVTVTVAVPELPAAIVPEAGETAIEKSWVGG